MDHSSRLMFGVGTVSIVAEN